MTGKWPEHEVDHINCDPSEARFCNLRQATRSQNEANKRPKRETKGIYVYESGTCKTYYVRVRINGTLRHLGTFKTQKEAQAAYNNAASNMYGSFARIVTIE